jgi:hypothetical protein
MSAHSPLCAASEDEPGLSRRPWLRRRPAPQRSCPRVITRICRQGMFRLTVSGDLREYENHGVDLPLRVLLGRHLALSGERVGIRLAWRRQRQSRYRASGMRGSGTRGLAQFGSRENWYGSLGVHARPESDLHPLVSRAFDHGQFGRRSARIWRSRSAWRWCCR